MIKLKGLLTTTAAFGVAAVLAGPVLAGPVLAFPNGPIEFVIPFGAGGGADIEGRLLAKEMSKVLGVPVVPVNKPGAGGAITYTYIKNSKPDGQKVAWASTSVLTSTNIGNTNFDYDALDHIGMVEFQPLPFVVKSTSPWKTFQDFVKACKANPNKYKIANSTTGSATHTGAIAYANAAGCKVIHLPKGIKGRNKSVLNGEADAMVAPLTGAARLTKAKKMRILAMSSAERNPVFPDVPTAKELGYNFDMIFFRSLAVSKGTPAAIKDKLAGAMAKAAKSKAFMGLAKKKGFTVHPTGHKAFSEFLMKENENVKAIFKSAGLYKSKMKK